MSFQFQISHLQIHRRRKRLIVALAIILPVIFVLSIVLGAVTIPLSNLRDILLLTNEHPYYAIIVQEIRIPRVLLAAILGAVLAVSGAATQGLFRNPLADPSLIGVTAGASVAASLAIVLGIAELAGAYSLTVVALFAFIGGVLSVWLVYRFSTSQFGTSVPTMLLAGIALTAIAGSLSSFLEFFSTDIRLRQVSLWKMGSLEGASYFHVLLAVIIAFPVLVLIPKFANALNALLLGESEARHLGVHVDQLKRLVIFVVALGVGGAVALAGTIAFVGLVVPHIIRLAIGPDHKYLFPVSAMFGAGLLVLSDLLARIIIAPTEIPVGIVTAFIGAPVFISLLRKRHLYGV